MKLYYTLSKVEEERYFTACDAMLDIDSAGQIAGLIQRKTGKYVAGQTIRDWFSAPGHVPTDIAATVLAKEYTVKLEHLCPWLKGLLRGRNS